MDTAGQIKCSSITAESLEAYSDPEFIANFIRYSFLKEKMHPVLSHIGMDLTPDLKKMIIRLDIAIDISEFIAPNSQGLSS